MVKRLEKLWQLQNIDIKIAELHKVIEEKLKEFEASKNTILSLKKEWQAKKESANKKKLKLRELENEIKSLEEKVKKMVSQLYTVKTNQEYTALDMEIKNCKADINVKENELLNFALEIDKFMLELQEFENKVNFEEQLLEKKAAQLEKTITEYNEKIKEAEKEREKLRAEIEPTLLNFYDRISAKKTDKKTLAYVKPLETVDGSNNSWACSECNMIITMQELNNILLEKEIVLCRSCSRILDIKLPQTTEQPSTTNQTNN